MALSEKDLSRILNELCSAKSKWYSIGIQLGLEISVLDSIRKEYRENADDCLCHIMFVAWLKSSSQVPKTWSTLADVLEGQTVGFGELATKIEEKFCQSQPQTGEKRPHPGDESETITKRSHLEEGCKCEELKELLLTNNQHIHELISGQNKKLKFLENSIKERDVQIEALIKENKELKMEKSTLKQRCGELKEQMEEHSQQLQQLTTQIQKIQNETAKNEMSQVSESTPNLPPTKTKFNEIDDNILLMRRALHKMRDDWYEIGCEFQVGLQFLDDIKTKHGENSKHCLFLVLREWLTQLVTQGNKECKMCILIDVLRSPLLEHYDLADTLEYMWHSRCPFRRDGEYGRFYPF